MSLSKQGGPLDENIRNKIVNLWISGENTAAQANGLIYRTKPFRI